MILKTFVSFYNRLMIIILDLPIRLKRFFVHFLWFTKRRSAIPQLIIVDNFWEWIVFIPFYIIDILGIPDLYQIILDIVFIKSRHLTEAELDSSYRLFRNSIRYHLVKVNENERWVAKRLNIAYVSFETIHTSKSIHIALLIHELVHVWQYTQFGSVYIYKALQAQRSSNGYNYGGRIGLEDAADSKKRLYAFNFEQQGDIVSDYFKLSSGLKPNWIENNTGGLILYKPFITNLLEIRRFKGHSLIFKDKSVKKGDGMA